MKRKLSVLFTALLTFVLILGISSRTALASREDASEDTSEVVQEETSDDDSDDDNEDTTEDDEVIEFEEEMICSGVFIDAIEIGGKSVTQAKAEVDKYGREAFEKTIGDAISILK